MWLISASQWTVHNVGSRYLAEQGRETQSHEAVSSAPTLRSITTKWMCLKKKSQQKHLILLIILIKFYLLTLIFGEGIESLLGSNGTELLSSLVQSKYSVHPF